MTVGEGQAPETAQVESWTKVVLVNADCLTCGAILEAGVEQSDVRRLRVWARHHAETHPTHHVVVEVTRGTSYRVCRPGASS